MKRGWFLAGLAAAAAAPAVVKAMPAAPVVEELGFQNLVFYGEPIVVDQAIFLTQYPWRWYRAAIDIETGETVEEWGTYGKA